MYASTEQRRRERVQILADQLYRERYHYLLRIARGNGAGGDANDAVNDAFAAFIDKFDPASGSPPLGWITLTLQRRCWAINHSRRLDRSQPGVAAGALINSIPSRATGLEQLAAQVDEARTKLATLKPQELRALLASFLPPAPPCARASPFSSLRLARRCPPATDSVQ